MLECKSLTAGYDRLAPILKDVSLAASTGEITAILGLNGAGKSTLFKAVLQEIRYTGRIFCDNSDLALLKPRERAALVSVLPQQLPAPALTVRETVALGLSPRTARPGEAEWSAIAERAAQLELTPLLDRPVNTLSGGERQRVFFAMTLVQDAPVMLLDEPTAHMDLPFVSRFFEILQAEKQQHKTVLLIMHDINEAFAHADRIAVLKNGALAFAGTTAEALAQNIPEKHFGLTRYVAQRGEKTAVFFKAE